MAIRNPAAGVVGSSALGEYEKRDKFAMVPRHCHVHTCMFQHVIANQCAHWCGNPYSLRWGVAESSAQGEYGKAVNLPR